MKQDKDGRQRKNIVPGTTVGVVQKKDQASGKITTGTVGAILTGSSFHPHGIKVRLTSGIVGRVQEIGENINP
ncbi:putative repeat protein (TIGR03833 family) [Methanolinea mesophila]|uniref:YwbE family protein n=1 Tax=Methanolinea mesophila TaxID=547055 RepID=UPI001AE6FE34|nr:putative repeat protein (TIGR03833 family) [Methanolinea mesophila]